MSEIALESSLEGTLKVSKAKSPILSRRKLGHKEKLVPYLYLLPSFILFGLFVYYPFFKTIYLSFNLTNRRGEAVEFVELENYIELLTSASFYNSLGVTFKFAILIIIPTMVISLALALLADNKLKHNRIYELMFSMPMAIASAPAAMIWILIFHPTNGIANYLLNTNIRWLADPKVAIYVVAFVTVWLGLGMNFIFLFTGLKSVPKELIESANIDGASYLQKVKAVILPLLTPQLFFVLFMNLVGAFQAFGQIKLLTQGGPGDSTNVIVHSIYRDAFFNGRFEMASSQSIILFLIVFSMTLVQLAFEKKGVHYK